MKKYIPHTILTILVISALFLAAYFQQELWKQKKENNAWWEATIGLSYTTPSSIPGVPKLNSVNSPETLKLFVAEYARNSRK